MRRLILAIGLIGGMAIAHQLFSALPGGDEKYSALIGVRDESGNPVTCGVFVQLWVQTWYGQESDPQVYDCFKTGVTGSSGTIYLECLIPAQNAEGLLFCGRYLQINILPLTSSSFALEITWSIIWGLIQTIIGWYLAAYGDIGIPCLLPGTTTSFYSYWILQRKYTI